MYDVQKQAYNELLKLLEDYPECALIIPEEWAALTLECLKGITSICPTIILQKIYRRDDTLVVDYNLHHSDEYCRAYVEDEIIYANMDVETLLKEKKKDDKMIGFSRKKSLICL